MDDFQKQLKQLSGFLGYVNGDVMSKKDFTKFIQALTKVWNDLKISIDRKIQKEKNELKGEITEKVEATRRTLSSQIDTTKSQLTQQFRDDMAVYKSQMDNRLAGLQQSFELLEMTLPEEADFKPVYAELEAVRRQIPTVPDFPQEVLDRIEKLENDHERWTKSATPRYIPGFFGGRVAHIPLVDDFSDSTDGSTKTFELTKAPRTINTMKIWGSDFPYILRPTTDFTISGKFVTLTSEVDAPTEGATLICEYYV